MKNKRLLVRVFSTTHLPRCSNTALHYASYPRGLGRGAITFFLKKREGVSEKGGNLIGDLQYFYRFRIHL